MRGLLGLSQALQSLADLHGIGRKAKPLGDQFSLSITFSYSTDSLSRIIMSCHIILPCFYPNDWGKEGLNIAAPSSHGHPWSSSPLEACPEASTQILFRLIPSLKRTGANMYLATSSFLNMEDLLVTLRDMEAWASGFCRM